MNTRKITAIFLGMLTAAVISACSKPVTNQAIPDVSDESCKPENIAKIVDKAAQKDFASKCFSRGQFKPSPKREW